MEDQNEQEAPIHRRYFLKSKIKSLAAEAYINSLDEAKLIRLARKRAKKGKSRANLDRNHAALRQHHIQVVRVEARLSQLAYGFLRGRDYSTMEGAVFTVPSWDRVESIVRRFTDEDWRVVGQKWAAWKDGAKAAAEASRAETVRRATNKKAMSRATKQWYETAEGVEYRYKRHEQWRAQNAATASE